MSDTDKAWHASFKPHFTSEGKLIVKSRTAAANDRVWEGTAIARSHNRTIVLNELKPREQLNMNDLTKNAAIELSESGIPQVEYNALPFSTHAASLSSTASSSEARLYELLHLLFDDYEDNYTSGLSDVQRGEFGDRIRKDRLSAFLSHLIAQKDKTTLTMLEMRNPVEAALRWLVRGDAIKASDLLYKSRNPTMALLVAQAPNAGEEFQSAVVEQINNWREQSALSEIDVHIRALYELLAGNTTVSEGVEGTTLEHKAATFAISDLLGLDWLNMFALNLWYGTHKTGTIEDIVAVFDSLLSSGEETASPVLPGGHQDPLWVALKIYASTITTTANNVLKCPIIPQSISALAAPYSGFDSLALFRTHHALATSLPALDIQIDIDEDAADQLAADLATECEMRGDVAGAVWATLHIDEEQVRGRAVVEVLLRNAARLPVPSPLPSTLDGSNGSEEWNVLTKALAVPETWIYQALALLKRAEGGGDAAEEELAYLVKAEEMEQAHQCFVERVAPVLVVDEDWEGLEQMLGLFGAEQGKPEGWREGGGVFEDFLRLVNMKEKAVVGEEDSKEVLVGRLARSLAAMAKDVEGQERKLGEAVDEGIVLVRRRVAVREMARMVVELAGVGVGDGDGDSAGMRDVLMELPLTSEIKTRLGRQMAREYYGKIMSGRAS
jgi:nuclear pore complex protein Nup98-Nup96